MKLYKDGITRNTDNPAIIAELKKAGYVEVIEEKQEIPVEEKATDNADAKEGE